MAVSGWTVGVSGWAGWGWGSLGRCGPPDIKSSRIQMASGAVRAVRSTYSCQTGTGHCCWGKGLGLQLLHKFLAGPVHRFQQGWMLWWRVLGQGWLQFSDQLMDGLGQVVSHGRVSGWWFGDGGVAFPFLGKMCLLGFSLPVGPQHAPFAQGVLQGGWPQVPQVGADLGIRDAFHKPLLGQSILYPVSGLKIGPFVQLPHSMPYSVKDSIFFWALADSWVM